MCESHEIPEPDVNRFPAAENDDEDDDDDDDDEEEEEEEEEEIDSSRSGVLSLLLYKKGAPAPLASSL